MKRVLVTGATGFIGRNALAQLVSKGYEVHAVSSRPFINNAPPVNWHCCNLIDSNETALLIAKIRPTHLLHFAWYAEHGKFWHSLENFRWLEASIALLRNFREAGGQRIVMAGTCAEYTWDDGTCIEGTTPCRPVTPYGVCKNALQEVLHSYSNEVGLSSAWGRIFFLYGPNEHPVRLISSVINSLLRGETANCTHGNQLRDFMHVEDVALAFVALLDSNVIGPVNISTGRPMSLREIVLTAANYIGASELVAFGALSAPVREPPILVGDNQRLRNEVGWSEQRDIEIGVEQTVDWWRNLDKGII